MDDEADPKAKTPWYRRATPLIATVGAVVAATVSIIGLWDRFFPADPEDVASIEMVEVVRQSALRDFVTENLGTNLPLVPEREDAAIQIPDDGAPGAVLAVVPSNPPEPGVLGTSATPEPGPGVPTGLFETSESADPGEPTAESTEPATPPSDSDFTALDVLQEVSAEDVGVELFGDPAFLAPEDTNPFSSGAMTRSSLGVGSPGLDSPVPTGEAASPEVVTAQIVEALSVVEGTFDANPEPRGWVVAVDLSLEGLSGEPLLLIWSLDGVDVPQSWANDTLAYRVQANTNRDSATAEIWVPDLAVPGTYKVNVKLIKESDRDAIARGSSELPNQ